VSTATARALSDAIDSGRVGDRLWLYANYHCNLHCVYCLTDSAPAVPRRILPVEQMVAAAEQARGLGFRALGVTGGEPFLIPEMPEILVELARRLPVVVLSNATLFTPRLLDRMRPLAQLPVIVQISLDSAEPDVNDEMRSPHNFAKVVDAVPRLIDLGIPVRIATTGDHNTPGEMERLCALHRSLGVPDADHVVRPIVHRGRAADNDLGVVAEPKDLHPELTLTADGSFWSPFAPTVQGGRLDTDLMVTRQKLPLEAPTRTWLALADANPEGTDSTLNIR
jgi:MoaA/NifB/PqqE/SkfB family radical SAM enzyme